VRTVVIDPVTRIEGHLKMEVVVDGGEVKEARSSGTLFRGLEVILKGRDPRDAQQLTQRICGVCPVSHATASAFCLEDALGISSRIPVNARIMRNLILGANYIQSHILHFYHLAALDYVDITRVAEYAGEDVVLNAMREFLGRGEPGPFAPQDNVDYRLSSDADRALAAHYVAALDMRRKAHEMLALFGGKVPHLSAIVPGGVSEVPTVDKIASFFWRLNELRSFIDNVYIPDVLEVARAYPDYFEVGRGCGALLSYGVFPLTSGDKFLKEGTVSEGLTVGGFDPSFITEDIACSFYGEGSDGLHPLVGETSPSPGKEGAYSWLKSPRYAGGVYEVGPLARMMVTYLLDRGRARPLVDSALGELGVRLSALFSVMGRHAARALECKLIADAMADWLWELKPEEPVYVDYVMPDEASGMGLTEASRGALGHWVNLKGGKVERYQCVVPTTWNASPRDAAGKPGPIEQAVTGTKIADPGKPIEVLRIVRSFDPCIACAVHVVDFRGREFGVFRAGG